MLLFCLSMISPESHEDALVLVADILTPSVREQGPTAARLGDAGQGREL